MDAKDKKKQRYFDDDDDLEAQFQCTNILSRRAGAMVHRYEMICLGEAIKFVGKKTAAHLDVGDVIMTLAIVAL